MTRVPRLVLVTNRLTAQLPLPELAVEAIAGGVDCVQIREKDLAEPDLRTLVGAIVEAVGDHGRLMVNGSAKIAAEFGIGLHLPEAAPVPADELRAKVPAVSRSVHAATDLSTCSAFDFVIAGHVFETTSKPGLPPLGLDGFGKIVRECPVPVVAIGGITPERVQAVIAAGAAGVAVQSAINNSRDPKVAASRYFEALEQTMTDTATQSIQMEINGKPVAIPAGTTVAGYLKSKGFHDRLVVVELNGTIVPKAAFASTLLSAGDRVEIVHFVGGG